MNNRSITCNSTAIGVTDPFIEFHGFNNRMNELYIFSVVYFPGARLHIVIERTRKPYVKQYTRAVFAEGHLRKESYAEKKLDV